MSLRSGQVSALRVCRQCTALHWACLANKPSAINLLLSLNCALLASNDGNTAMDFCIKHKLVEAARAMLTNATSRSVAST